MKSDAQYTLFEVPATGRKQPRRRARPSSPCDEALTCRRDRAARRNRILVARYYYWTEIHYMRFDYVLRVLADREFFIDERTVSSALVEHDDYYRELLRTKPSRQQFRRLYPGFDWA